jgi:deferrochelatase/peroxidase EfeB
MNPRGDTGKLIYARVPLEEERAHRIVRRSAPFGRPEDIGKSAVGLLFLCFQGDIARQFEVMQIVWANSVQFIEQTTGLDPIIGQRGILPEGQKWPKKWGDLSAGTIRAPSAHCVTLKGGDYFFAPSVGFLRNIHANC